MTAHILCSRCGEKVHIEVITPAGLWKSWDKPIPEAWMFARELGSELQLPLVNAKFRRNKNG